jgi:glycoside/pentoside/hexuronide:cation symporter, GPH family
MDAATTTAPSKAPPLGLPGKLFYGFGSIAYGVKDSSISTFLLIFYNQVVGLPAQWVGAVIMMALILDAFLDPVIGQVSDHWRSAWGRRHPFMYFSAVPVAGLFILLWHPPQGWSNTALLAYLMAVFVAVRFCITLYEIPSSALVAELTDDYDERTRLVSWRLLFAVMGGIAATFVAYRLFLVRDAAHPVGVLNRSGYGHFAIAAAGVMVASILISAAGTHHRVRYLRQLAPASRPKLGAMAREMVASLSNRSFLFVTAAALFSSMAAGLASGLDIYFRFYFWGFTNNQASILALAGIPAAVLGLMSAAFISGKLGKRNACILTAVISVSTSSATYVLKLAGLMPPDGSNPLLAIIFLSTLVSTTLAVVALILYFSMIADVVEDSQLKTGRRSEGLFFAASSFVEKAVSGVGVFISSLLLGLVHFPAHAEPGKVDPAIIRNLVLIFVPSQAALYVVTMLLLACYRISRDSHQDNLRKLSDAAAAIELAGGGEDEVMLIVS